MSEEDEIRVLLEDNKRWVSFMKSFLEHNPWDPYLETKMESVKKCELEIQRLQNERKNIS